MRIVIYIIATMFFLSFSQKTFRGSLKNTLVSSQDSISTKELKGLKVVEYWNDKTKELDSVYEYKKDSLTLKGIVKYNNIIYYDIDNNVIKEGGIRKGKLNGIVTFFKNNRPYQMSQYIEGLKQGITVYYNDSLQVEGIVNYLDDLPNGLFISFNELGHISKITSLLDKDTIGPKIDNFHYENGTLKISSERNTNENINYWEYFYDEKHNLIGKVFIIGGEVKIKVGDLPLEFLLPKEK